MEMSLVRRWAAEGSLPTLRRMLTGFSTELRSTSEQLPDTVWASIYTGMNPAKYRKYFYVQYDPSTGDLKHVSDEEIGGVPFWDYLSRAGQRVVIADVPKFPASRQLNGIHVANWGAHATKTARATTPPTLLDEVNRRFGSHAVGDCDKVDDRPASLLNLRERIIHGVRQHGELFRWLMQKEPWDVFFAGFSAPHCIGHHFWHHLDRSHPRHPSTDPHGLAASIESVYRALDEEIGHLMNQAGPEVQCMVFAGHGMGPLFHASWHLPELLESLGYGRAPGRGTVNDSSDARVNGWRILRMVLPGRLQYAIKACLPKRLQDELLFRWYAGARDWKGHQAFAVPNNDSVGAIRINVIGRDRFGVVRPEEYPQVCRELAGALNELVDPDSGRSIIRRVTLTHEEFHGPFLDQLPDITVLWEQSFAWHAVHSPRFGTVRTRRQDGRTGSHAPRGFLLACGPGIEACQADHAASLYDIAPTVLASAGVAIPDSMDGTPLRIRADLSQTMAAR